MKGRKGLAIAIMSKIPKPGKDDGDDEDKKDGGSDEETEDGNNEGYVAAFRALRKAIESGNDDKGADALKDFVGMC